MKKFLLLTNFMLSCFCLKADVIITGILDGTLLGGCPKAIELYIAGTEDLSNYRLERAVNGQGFGGSNSTKVLSGVYTDAFVYLLGGSCTGVNSFASVFGTSGDFGNTDNIFIATMNGNDAFRITRVSDGQVVDQFGNPNSIIDTYADSYAIRADNTNFFFPGNGILKGLTASQIAATVPFGSFILPVELIAFKVFQKGGTAKLEWRTATETNNDFFYIERSQDGKDYKRIGKVHGAGTSTEIRNYVFIDENPALDLNYYRLHQVDFDGTSSMSKVITLSFKGKDNPVRIKPSIAFNQVTIELTEISEGGIQMKVFDLFGRLYYYGKFPVEAKSFDLDISDYPAGHYLVYFQEGENFFAINRFIKK